MGVPKPRSQTLSEASLNPELLSTRTRKKRVDGVGVTHRVQSSPACRAVFLGLSLVVVAPAPANESFPLFEVDSARDYLRTAGQNLLNATPSNATPYLAQARLFDLIGEQDQARRLARQAQELEPNRADTFLFLGEMAVKAGQLEQARQAFLQALERQPRIPGGNRRLGMVLSQMGDRGGAKQAWLAALATDARDATGHLLLGQLLLDLGEPQQALRYLTNAVALDPDTANAYYTLGQTQIRLGQTEAARASLQLFQELKNQEQRVADEQNAARDNTREMRELIVTFHLHAASFLEEQGRLELAEAHYRQATRVHPEAQTGFEALTGFLLRQGRRNEARELWQDLIERHPDQAPWHFNYASLLLQLGETSAARSALERGLALDSNRVDALNNLARIYLGSGQRLSRALELGRKLVEFEPSAANYDLLAWAHYANGQVELAREASARSVELDPANPVFRARYSRLKEVQ